MFNYKGVFMRAPVFVASIVLACTAAAQTGTVSLDSCRAMALTSNKELMMSRQRISTAKYQKKEAFAAYLPSIDFAGGYMYNQKELSIFDSDQMLPTKTFDVQTQSYQFNLAKNPLTGEPIKDPATGQYVPETVALIPKEAMTYDIHNVFFGAITLTQPIYMGGKIVAMNKITKQAEGIAKALHNQEAENVVYAVDAAYWMVVSLRAKQRLAEQFVQLLDTLDRNIHLMYEQGVATHADVLSVDVKLNQAQVDLTKVNNGLSLSRMALAQVCGLPVDTQMTLADENTDASGVIAEPVPHYNMADVYERRNDLQALRLGVDVAGQKANLAKASMLPNIALIGTYSFSNPNMFDGFKKRFNGAFSVGAMVTIPIWHWGGNYNKYRAAKSEETSMRLQLQDAEEKISLQVSQAAFRAEEAAKTYRMTQKNIESADANLRTATLGFREGMVAVDIVMAAQTAWLAAYSENVDAMIDIRLCDTYLNKVLGMPIASYNY